MKNHSKFRFLLFIPLVLAGMILFGFVTMLLWNALFPAIFHLPLITFWQAVGLLVLTRLLFGSFCHHSHGHHRLWGHDFRHKWETMTPEEREQFMKMRQSCRTPWGRYPFEKNEQENSGTLESN